MSDTMPTGSLGNRRRAAAVAALALALIAALGLALGSTAEAKKKHKKGASVFQAQVSPNAAIPDAPATAGPSTPVRSTITIGKKFKGKVVGDVNVTGIQTTGNTNNAARDLRFKLTAPNGRTAILLGASIGNASIGPLTLDDDSPVGICDADTPGCSDPALTLLRPFAGTANLTFLGDRGTGGLRAFNGVPMKGSWTFTIWDQGPAGNRTSVLNSWGLKITAQKPVK